MEQLIHWLVADGNGYPVIFAVLLASGLGLPIPEDVPLLAAGVMAANGGMPVVEASIACGVFILVRDIFVFTLGYRYGVDLLQTRWASRIIKKEMVDKVQARVRKNGILLVFTGRFTPVVRVAIFFTAGTAKVRPASFVAVDAFAAAISVPVWVWVGAAFADNFDQLTQIARSTRWGLIIALAVLLGLVAVKWSLSRRGSATGDPAV